MDRTQYLKLQCPDCGAPLEVQGKSHAVCHHCGQKFIIDEAGGLVVNMDVDYGDGKDTKNSITATLIVMGFILGIAFIVLIAVFSANYEAIHSRLFSSDYDLLGRGKDPVKIFCEDIFDKDYKEITEEEFASIRYIKYDNDRLPGTGENVHIIEYSFKDYQDCESEEDFQATIKRWTCQQAFTRDHEMNFNMLTGLTRVAIGGHSHLIKEDAFSKEADIRYVTTSSETDGEQFISKRVDPNKVEVLEFKAWDNLEGIEVFPNLRELNIEIWFGYHGEFDFSQIGNCKNLEKLVVKDRADIYIGMEQIGELKQLKSLSMENIPLNQCDFISELWNLEELTIRVDEENPCTDRMKYLPNLKYLYLTGLYEYVPAKDIHWFEGVEVLKLSVDDLEAVEKLAELESLKVLDVYIDVPNNGSDPWDNEGMLDVSSLADLSALEYLYIQPEPGWNVYDVYVYGLEEVLNRTQIKAVYINEQLRPFEPALDEKVTCRIDTELLEDNKQLKYLQFRDCIFEDINTETVVKPDFMNHYTNLEYLVMDGCGLTDISFVEKMSGLKYCSFAGNEIQDFAPLNQCKFLEVAALYGNPNTEPALSGEVVVLKGGPEGVNLTEYLLGIEREVGYIKRQETEDE